MVSSCFKLRVDLMYDYGIIMVYSNISQEKKSLSVCLPRKLQENKLQTCKLNSIIMWRLLFHKSEIHVSNILNFLKYPFWWSIFTQQLKVLIDKANDIKDMLSEKKVKILKINLYRLIKIK